MEEKKIPLKKEDIDFLCGKFDQIVKYCVIHGYDEDNILHEFEKLFLMAEESDIKSNLKPFNLEAAKAGKPVCTRDGHKARIICFDRKVDTPIIALIEHADGSEILQCYFNNGKCCHNETSDYDLMMLPEKKEGWINIYITQIRRFIMQTDGFLKLKMKRFKKLKKKLKKNKEKRTNI